MTKKSLSGGLSLSFYQLNLWIFSLFHGKRVISHISVHFSVICHSWQVSPGLSNYGTFPDVVSLNLYRLSDWLHGGVFLSSTADQIIDTN